MFGPVRGSPAARLIVARCGCFECSWLDLRAIATESRGSPELPYYGHGGNTYGAQSDAFYFPTLGASLVVAANNELSGPEGRGNPQVSYVWCLAMFAAINALHGDNNPLRETCQKFGGGPVNGFDVYRDQNLREVSN